MDGEVLKDCQRRGPYPGRQRLPTLVRLIQPMEVEERAIAAFIPILSKGSRFFTSPAPFPPRARVRWRFGQPAFDPPGREAAFKRIVRFRASRILWSSHEPRGGCFSARGGTAMARMRSIPPSTRKITSTVS